MKHIPIRSVAFGIMLMSATQMSESKWSELIFVIGWTLLIIHEIYGD